MFVQTTKRYVIKFERVDNSGRHWIMKTIGPFWIPEVAEQALVNLAGTEGVLNAHLEVLEEGGKEPLKRPPPGV